MECATLAIKLRLDCEGVHGVLSRMDDDSNELATQLCTKIGMIMEDASVTALTIARTTDTERNDAIAQLDIAAHSITALLAAVHALGG